RILPVRICVCPFDRLRGCSATFAGCATRPCRRRMPCCCIASSVSGGALQIWEVATWTRRNEFKGGHRDGVTTLTFAPGGQLRSGSADPAVRAWDMRPPRVADSVSLESAWDALASREAGESFRSEGRFLSAPAGSVRLFAEKVKPAAALDPKRVERLLADLD